MTNANLIIGLVVIVINIIPFVMKKPKLLFLTALISLLLISLLSFIQN